jgi:glycosyltransferase involved in cell wall biosynthesis
MFLLPPVGKESTMQKIGRFYRKLTISAGKRRIDTCITISKYSAEQIKSKLNISSTCIPTYNGISHFSELFGIEMSCPVKRKDFYFTVSGDAPSKNISFLLEIFNTDLCRDTLIIAGIKNNSYLRKKEYPNIIFLNENISDTNLIHFYRTCKAFILPSLREGFGVPILEALLCGAPIIASNRTAIPEVLNGFGILFDPEDRKSFLNAINEINNFVVSETEIQEYLDKYIHNKKTILQILDVFNKADGVGGSYPCK